MQLKDDLEGRGDRSEAVKMLGLQTKSSLGLNSTKGIHFIY